MRKKHIDNFDFVDRKLAHEQSEKRRMRVLADWAANRSQFKKLAVVQLWMQSFDEDKMRYMFLVLKGPSRLGKTAYACSLSSWAEATLELNCMNTDYPNLREFVDGTHEVIVFDECSAKLVLLNRKLFQSSPSWIQMASSATNVYGHSVFVHKVRLIVCTNTWDEDLQKASPVDRAWLLANAVVVHVETKLWVDAA
jgi:hypothetical protein